MATVKITSFLIVWSISSSMSVNTLRTIPRFQNNNYICQWSRSRLSSQMGNFSITSAILCTWLFQPFIWIICLLALVMNLLPAAHNSVSWTSYYSQSPANSNGIVFTRNMCVGATPWSCLIHVLVSRWYIFVYHTKMSRQRKCRILT